MALLIFVSIHNKKIVSSDGIDICQQPTDLSIKDFEDFNTSLKKNVKQKYFAELKFLFMDYLPALKSMIEPKVNFTNINLKENCPNFYAINNEPCLETVFHAITKIRMSKVSPKYSIINGVVEYYNRTNFCSQIFRKHYDDKLNLLSRSDKKFTISDFTIPNKKMGLWGDYAPIVLVSSQLPFAEVKSVYDNWGCCDEYRCYFGLPPIVHAVITHNIELSKLLLQLGANLGLMDNNNNGLCTTTLHWIVVSGMYMHLKLLIPDNHEAWEVKNLLGLTPFDYLSVLSVYND